MVQYWLSSLSVCWFIDMYTSSSGLAIPRAIWGGGGEGETPGDLNLSEF